MSYINHSIFLIGSFKIPRQSEEYVENEQTSPIIITVPNNAKCIDENKKTVSL